MTPRNRGATTSHGASSAAVISHGSSSGTLEASSSTAPVAASVTAALAWRTNTSYTAVFASLANDPTFHSFGLLVEESAHQHVHLAPSTRIKHAEFLARFQRMHEHNVNLHAWRGREMDQDKLLERLKAFFTLIVASSRSVRDKSQHMKYSSLMTAKGTMLSLCRRYAHPDMFDARLQGHWSRKLDQFCSYLGETYKLSKEVEPRMYFGEKEYKKLFEAAVHSSRFFDHTLQHAVVWLFSLYSCSRPGSLLATVTYPDSYIKWQDISIKRRDRNPGEFMVDFVILAWKGGHAEQRFRQVYRVPTVRTKAEFHMDLGMLLVVMALRRGAFRDHASLDSVIAGEESILAWKEEFKTLPVFCAAKPKGIGLVFGAPMMADASRKHLKTICNLCNLPADRATNYCWRRHAATIYNGVLGSELAKSLMHHNQNGETLWRNYANNSEFVDTTRAILYGEKASIAGETEHSAPAVFSRIVQGPLLPPLSLEQAMLASEELSTLHMQKFKLRAFLQGEGDDADLQVVMEGLFPPENKFVIDDLRNVGDINEFYGALYGKISRRCNRMFSDMRSRYHNAQLKQNLSMARAPTISEIQERTDRFTGDGSLLRALKSLSALGNTDDSEDLEILTQKPHHAADSGTAIGSQRVAFMSFFVNFVELTRGAQRCSTCDSEERSLEQRHKTFVSLSSLGKHMGSHHPYLPGNAVAHQAEHETALLQSWGTWR